MQGYPKSGVFWTSARGPGHMISSASSLVLASAVRARSCSDSCRDQGEMLARFRPLINRSLNYVGQDWILGTALGGNSVLAG